MRSRHPALAGLSALLLASCPADAEPEVSEDYYFGFSQGAYYGLLLAGEDYDVAWCVRGELAHEAANLGVGAEFQEGIERILAKCRQEYGKREE